jgi:predicted RND superfamily exporter protein
MNGPAAQRLNWPARQPRLALAIALAATLAAIAGVARLRPDTSLRSLFSPRDKAASALNRVLEHFPVVEEMLLLVTAPSTGDPDPGKLLAFAGRLERQIDQDPQTRALVAAVRYRGGADDVREFITKVVVPSGIFYLSDDEFAGALHRLTRPEMAEQLARNEAMLAAPGPAAGALAKTFLKDPLRLHEFIESRLVGARPFKTYGGSDALISEDGRSLLIRIAGTRPPNDLDFCQKITTAISAAAQRANDDHLKLEYAGAYPIAAQSERSIRHDSIWSVNGSIACLFVLFLLAFRRPFTLFPITFAPVAVGILWGFGLYALWHRNVTPLTAVIGGVLGAIGIDYSIFYVMHYLERRAAGDNAVAAARATMSTIGGALVAAWVTSVVGFIAIVFASVPALRDLSIVGSLGLAGALLGAMFVLPAVLVVLARSPLATSRGEGKETRLSMVHLLGWIDCRASALVISCTALLLAMLLATFLAGPKIPLESDSTVLHPRPNPPLEAQSHIAQRMGSSPDSLVVHLQANSPNDLITLAHRVSDRLATPAAKNVGVTATLGLQSLLPDPALAPRRLIAVGEDVADRVTKDFDAALAESSFSPQAYDPYRTFLKILLTQRQPPGIEALEDYPQIATTFFPKDSGSVPTQAITLVFLGRSIDESGARRQTITELRRLLADCPGATLTGMAVLGLDTEATIQRDLPRLIGAAVGIVAVYLLLHFRSVAQALLAVLPTIFSLACLLAAAKLTGARLNLANIVSIPLLIGIDVDYGIFLVSVTRRTRTRAELLERVAPSSRAVVLCAAATLMGFGSLAFTSVPAIRSLGWAVAIGVTTCAAAALFFLLPLLLWLKTNPAIAAASLAVLALTIAGCGAPAARLTFPEKEIETTGDVEWFDVRHNGTRSFGIAYDPAGNVDRLLYDDDGDGTVDRTYRLADYPNGSVPHLILLLDSIPYETMAQRYRGGDFRWFGPPRKMIAPFPSLTEICYTDVLHAPPLPGVIDQYFDPRTQKRTGGLWKRVGGYTQPWERRLDYHIDIVGQGLSFLDADKWFAAELEQARRAVEASPDRVPIVYLSSAASMVCMHGRAGAEAVLDGARRLCLQLLYERRGAIKISMMADHGHNYMPSKNSSLAVMLEEAGFHPADRLVKDRDCVIEMNALVTVSGIHTRYPPEVASALVRHEPIEVAIYQQGDRSIIQTARGRAAVECRGARLRYVPVDGADVLGYAPVIDRLKSQGKMDAEGFADDRVWFHETLDHPWPNAPRRVWDALHGRFINPPDVILSLKDGYYSGYASYEKFVKMASTHGGLNQVNSATFVMTMTGRLADVQAVRHEDVLGVLEPGYEPRVKN